MLKSKVLELASGYRGRSRHCIRLARNRVEKGLLHAYVGRKLKKRDFRSLWITRMNAGARQYQLTYGRLIEGMNKLDITLNRKMMSELAVSEPYSFRSIVEQVKTMTNPPLTNFPSLGHVQTQLVSNTRNAAWNTFPLQRQALQQQFLQQHYTAAQRAQQQPSQQPSQSQQ